MADSFSLRLPITKLSENSHDLTNPLRKVALDKHKFRLISTSADSAVVFNQTFSLSQKTEHFTNLITRHSTPRGKDG